MYTFSLVSSNPLKGVARPGEGGCWVKRTEVEILFTAEAEREFDEIQRHGRPLIREWALRYLEDLLFFPPDDWVDIHAHLGGEFFKADNHVPFDIQGKILNAKNHVIEQVLITRFRLKNP